MLDSYHSCVIKNLSYGSHLPTHCCSLIYIYVHVSSLHLHRLLAASCHHEDQTISHSLLRALALPSAWMYSTRFVTLSIVVAPSCNCRLGSGLSRKTSPEFTRLFEMCHHIKPLKLMDLLFRQSQAA